MYSKLIVAKFGVLQNYDLECCMTYCTAVVLWQILSDSDLPPSYDIAAKLPTYEEAERVKEQYTDLVRLFSLFMYLACE